MNRYLSGCCLLGVLVVLLFVPSFAFAAYGSSPWDNALQTLVGFFTGTTGRLLGALGVIGVGVAALFGKLDWGRAGMVMVAIAIIVGAFQVVDLFAR